MNRGLELTDEEVGKIMRKARLDAIEECALAMQDWLDKNTCLDVRIVDAAVTAILELTSHE